MGKSRKIEPSVSTAIAYFAMLFLIGISAEAKLSDSQIEKIKSSKEFLAISGSVGIFVPPLTKVGKEEARIRKLNELRIKNDLAPEEVPSKRSYQICSLTMRDFRKLFRITQKESPQSTKNKTRAQIRKLRRDEKRPKEEMTFNTQFLTDCNFAGDVTASPGIFNVEHSIKDINPFYKIKYRLRIISERFRSQKKRLMSVEIMDGELYDANEVVYPHMTFAGRIVFTVDNEWEIKRIQKSEIFVNDIQGKKIEKLIPLEFN